MALPRTAAAPHQSTVYAAMPAEPDEDYGYQAPATTIRPGGIDPAAFTRPDLANSSIAGRPKEWDAYRRGQATQARQDERQQARIATAEQRAQDRAEAAQAKQDEKAALQRSYLDVLGKGQEPDLDPTSGVYQPKLNPATGTPQQRRYTTGDRPDPTGAGTYEVRENDAGQMVVDRTKAPKPTASTEMGDFSVVRGKDRIDPVQSVFSPNPDLRAAGAKALRRQRMEELDRLMQDNRLALDDPKFAGVSADKIRDAKAKAPEYQTPEDQAMVLVWDERQAMEAKIRESLKERYRVERMKPEEWEQEARQLHADKQDAAVMAHGATEAERLKKSAADIDAQTEALNARQARWEQEQALGVPSHGFEAHARELADIADTRRAIEAQQAELTTKSEAVNKWSRQEQQDSLHRWARGVDATNAAGESIKAGFDAARGALSEQGPLLPPAKVGSEPGAGPEPETNRPAPAEQDIRTLMGQTLREPVGAVMLNPKDSDYGQVVDKPENVPALMAHPQWDGRDLYLRRVDEAGKKERPIQSAVMDSVRSNIQSLAAERDRALKSGEAGFLGFIGAPVGNVDGALDRGSKAFNEANLDALQKNQDELEAARANALKGLVPFNKVIEAYRESGKDTRIAPDPEKVLDAAGDSGAQESKEEYLVRDTMNKATGKNILSVQEKRVKALEDYVKEWHDTPYFDAEKVGELMAKQGLQLHRETLRNTQGAGALMYRSGVKSVAGMVVNGVEGWRAMWNSITGDKEALKNNIQRVANWNEKASSPDWETVGDIRDQFRASRWSGSDWGNFVLATAGQMVPQVIMSGGTGVIGRIAGAKAAGGVTRLGLEGAAVEMAATTGTTLERARRAITSGLLLEKSGPAAGAITKMVEKHALARAQKIGITAGVLGSSIAQNASEYVGAALSSFKPEDVDTKIKDIRRAVIGAWVLGIPAGVLDMMDGNEKALVHAAVGMEPKALKAQFTSGAKRFMHELGGAAQAIGKEAVTGGAQGVLGVMSQRWTDGRGLMDYATHDEVEDVLMNLAGEAIGGGVTHTGTKVAGATAKALGKPVSAVLTAVNDGYKAWNAGRDLRVQQARIEKAMGAGPEGMPASPAVQNGQATLAELQKLYDKAVEAGDPKAALRFRQAQVFMAKGVADAAEKHGQQAGQAATEAAGSPLAQAVLRVASGEQVENMTDAEIGALGYERAPDGGVKPIKGVAPAVTKAPGGTWVVTDAAREATEGVAPSAKGLIRPEREVRQRDTAKTQAGVAKEEDPTDKEGGSVDTKANGMQALAAWYQLDDDTRDLLHPILQSKLAKKGKLTWDDIPGDIRNKIGTQEAGMLKDALEADPNSALSTLLPNTTPPQSAEAPLATPPPDTSVPKGPDAAPGNVSGKARDFGVKVRGEPEPRIIRAKSEKEAGDKVRGKLKKGQVIEKVEALPDDESAAPEAPAVNLEQHAKDVGGHIGKDQSGNDVIRPEKMSPKSVSGTSQAKPENASPPAKQNPAPKPGPRNVDSPESREYLNNGGWKLHLTVKPENYGAVDAWLEKNHPGQYKLLHGGDAGEKDFTVYVGSKSGASALAAKIEKEIGDKIEKSNAGSEDTPFGAKVAGRFDTLKRNGFSYYGRGGLPYDQDAKDAEFQMMNATDPEEKAKWRKILDNHEQRIKKTLADKYGERFTGEAPLTAKPKGTHFKEAQRQLGKLTPEQDKALRNFFDVAGRFLSAFDGVFSGVEWSNEDDPSAGFVYDSTRNVLRLHLPKLTHYMGNVDGKPRVNNPRKWALAAIAEEATHAVTVQLIAEGAIDPDALLAALRGASKASAQAFIDSYLGANGSITVKAKDGAEKEVSLQALEFIRMVVQGRITLDVDGVRVDGELTELQYNKSLLKKIFEAITKVLEVLKVLSSSKSPVAAAIRDEADKIARRLDALMSARPDVAKSATSDTEQSQVASNPPGDSAKVSTSPTADQQTETGAAPGGVVAPEPVTEKPAAPDKQEWTDERQKDYRKRKAALNRAINAQEWEKVVSLATADLAHFEATAWPDDWSMWERAKEDAERQIERAKPTEIGKPLAPKAETPAPAPNPSPVPATEITVQQHTLLNRDIKPMDKTIKISEIPKELKRQSQMLAVLNALIPCLKA